jgi:hypothetical protein
MLRRIELINNYEIIEDDGRRTGFRQDSKSGIMGQSDETVIDAWIDKLRGPSRSLPRNAFFWFTEKGWREVGRAVIRACIASGQSYRVIRIKENEVDVVWRDKFTGLEVAAQPKRPNRKDRT